MTTPSWIELVGRNVAAEILYLSGTLSVNLDGSVECFRFWHGPRGQWWIESGDDVLYASASGQSPIVRVDEHMRNVYRPVKIGAAAHSPLDLLGQSSIAVSKSHSLELRREPALVEIEGRRAWSTELGSGGERDARSVVVIDDATGVLSHYDTARVTMAVSDLVEHENLPSERFTWTGPVVEDHPRDDNSPAAKAARAQRQQETAAARAAALDKPFDVLRTLIEAADAEHARAALRELLQVSEFGADAVEGMPLRFFNPEYANKIRGQRTALADGDDSTADPMS